jgi:dienelactone hydrolase
MSAWYCYVVTERTTNYFFYHLSCHKFHSSKCACNPESTMRIKLLHLIWAVFCFASLQTSAQQTSKMTSTGIGYLEYLPQGYKTNSNNYPIVISLHGIKEKGNTLADVARVANVGLPKYVKYGQQYPFILISPQLKTSMSRWAGDYVMQVINHVKKSLRIDSRRIYLTGLSLGGGGVWSVATAYPSVFAAILPICSGYNVTGSAYKIASENIATWGFHGDKDYTVNYTVTQKMINAINSCTPKPSPLAKFTIFPGMGHIIWDKVYKETSALSWMLGFTNGSSSSTTSNSAPLVSAGGDKTITLPTNYTTLQATASDTDGSVRSYVWTKLSGGTVSMSGTTSSKVSLSNMVAGSYYFRVTVKDDDGASKYDDVKVTVSSSTTNKLPIVSAGSDKTTSNTGFTIVGSASDSDGYIAAYKWTKVSGPSISMSNTTSSKLWASSLVSGTYYFRLTVTDNKGGTKYDDMKLVVSNSSSSSTVSNSAPTVSAGSDKSTSNSGFTVVGSASDPDGYIASYKWTKISGPTLSMSNTTSAKLWASNLVRGTYYFRLTVKDNMGAIRYDDMKLNVY